VSTVGIEPGFHRQSLRSAEQLRLDHPSMIHRRQHRDVDALLRGEYGISRVHLQILHMCPHA
jgi:hypothetical protein